jgi:23S rRNA (cytosine1962-C5)-methyltransferase
VSAFRLVHGAADNTPGLAVDRYADVAILHADSSEIVEAWLPEVRAELDRLCTTGYVKVHPRGVSRVKPGERGRFAPETPAWGLPRDEVTVIEHGVHYGVRPSAGLSVGLFLDMRDVRLWLRQHTQARSVLNLFSYTCSFGVCAVLGGAQRVVNLDLSRPYLDWGKANYAQNDLEVDAHDFIYGDAFDWLARFTRRRQLFDVVILDPPSFSSTPFSVTRDYVRLVESAVAVVAPGGTLVAATNHAATSARRFEGWLADGLSRAGRGGYIAQRWHEPSADFPVAGGERPYLKVRALELN